MSNPIIIEYKVNAPTEKVWKALTDKNEMKSWYFDIADFDLWVGKMFNFYEPGEEKKFHHVAEILEIIPNQKLKHTWSYPKFSDLKSTVTWELQPEEDQTIIKLTHDDIDNFKDLGDSFSRDSFTEGWNGIIGQSLKPYLES
ncbi:SRPBCC family protein [Chryseobacterium daeguense]|uniref:SRPBCC family protein n=1 Tax=Chryseobacterium daeguense TaxID=412438 RepID=UPI000401FA1B|nr:SRPBCC domain-containing protein [Chryseobacterium daeguense]